MNFSGKHGPNRLSNYMSIHQTVMSRFRDAGFVVLDDLRIADLGNRMIEMSGLIRCERELMIGVVKFIRLISGNDADAVVQTTSYSYNTFVRNVGNIFRYCSPHAGDDIEHHQHHHVHRYDVLSGDVSGGVELIHNEDDVPTLGEVIQELQNWQWANGEALIELLRKHGVAS